MAGGSGLTTALRPLRFAGSFFPAGPAALGAAVDRAMAGAEGLTAGAAPRAVIAAHAGYAYSGRFAGLSHGVVPGRPGRAAILSPSHRLAFRGIAFPSQDAFATPIGPLPLDRAACEDLAGAGLARELDAAHDDEHGVETQLPFLARAWPGLAVVPLVIGGAAPGQVAAVIDRLDDGATLFVLSSDLSHFLDDGRARAIDAETARLIERGEAQGLDGAHACGWQGVAGWLGSRAGGRTRALRLGMGNSGEVSGDLESVVGYGAWAFYDLADEVLSPAQRRALLGAAREAVARAAAGEAPPAVPGDAPTPLMTEAASFVTLMRDGELRGCMGSLEPRGPLIGDVLRNARAATLHDPRFPRVTPEEVAGLRLKISVLTRAAAMEAGSEAEALAALVPGRDGLILEEGDRRATFLPAVWDSLPEPAAFLRELKRKAGLAAGHWSDRIRLSRYRAEEFGEEG